MHRIFWRIVSRQHALFVFILVGGVCLFGAWANSFPSDPRLYECNMAGSPNDNLPPCPSNPDPNPNPAYVASYAIQGDGTCTGSKPFCGAKANAFPASAPIEAFNVCRWVDNAKPDQSPFVPFKSIHEWLRFVISAPTIPGGAVHVTDCAIPYMDNGGPSSVRIVPTHINGTLYEGCSAFLLDTPTVYGRTGLSLYPDPPKENLPATFSCQNGATVIQSSQTPLQWIAASAGTPFVRGKLSWYLPKNFTFGPDIALSAKSASKGAKDYLGWAISPFNPGDAVACSVDPPLWGPAANATPSVGVSTVARGKTYTMTCTENTLTSIATIAAP